MKPVGLETGAVENIPPPDITEWLIREVVNCQCNGNIKVSPKESEMTTKIWNEVINDPKVCSACERLLL